MVRSSAQMFKDMVDYLGTCSLHSISLSRIVSFFWSSRKAKVYIRRRPSFHQRPTERLESGLSDRVKERLDLDHPTGIFLLSG